MTFRKENSLRYRHTGSGVFILFAAVVQGSPASSRRGNSSRGEAACREESPQSGKRGCPIRGEKVGIGEPRPGQHKGRHFT